LSTTTKTTRDASGKITSTQTVETEPAVETKVISTSTDDAGTTTQTQVVTQDVITGKHILTGENIVKERPVPKPPKNWSTPDRKQYQVHTSITGSVNNRALKLVKGEWVYLNEDELQIFRMYVSGAGKP
jgi:hypothetical protein